MPNDHHFLSAAVHEAEQGRAEGGIPIGSVLVRAGEIVGRGHNRRVQEGDQTAHAEIDCLRNAGRQRTLKDTVLYSSLMPCYLCAGAIVQFGIPRVVAGPGGFGITIWSRWRKEIQAPWVSACRSSTSSSIQKDPAPASPGSAARSAAA